MKAAFYCVSSRIYFLGAVGLINSLRLVGHTEPIYLLDCGLARWQRDLLRGEVTVVPRPQDGDVRPEGDRNDEMEPFLLKTVAPLAHRTEVMVLIDADMIVTRPLTDLLDRAAEGAVVAFRNDTDRFVAEWGELLGLGAARRQGPYLSSGLVVLGGRVGAEVLRLMDSAQRRARFDLGIDIRSKDAPDHPFLYLDQDVLNAVVDTSVDPDRVLDLDPRLAPNQPYRGLRLIDEAELRCSYPDGERPYVLHQYLGKPWLEPMYHGIYSRLLSRLLLAPDVAIRVPEQRVPLRIRRGLVARLERKRVDFKDLVRWYARDVIPEWVAGRREALRRRQARQRETR